MNVLVIPEDFRKDQFVFRPVIEAMLAAAGRPHAKVPVCMDPLLGRISQALKWTRIEEIIEQYQGMVEVFILAVDRDADQKRRAQLDSIEANAAKKLGESRFYAENAWQEIEVWAIAGQSLPLDWQWADIRAHRDPKERYFDPLAAARNLQNESGGGRATLGREAGLNYKRVRARCPEDIQTLETRLAKKFDCPD